MSGHYRFGFFRDRKEFFVFIFILFYFFYPTCSFSNEIDNKCSSHVIWGAPQISSGENEITYLCRSGYAVAYKNTLKNPLYVVEHLTTTRIGKEIRTNNFRIDYDLKENYRTTTIDYIRSGFDKGHMSPAANNSSNKKSMSESFLLSNIVPQNSKLNRGIWRKLEILIRDWVVKENRELFIIQGTIFEPGYQTIGNKVAVPSKLFKIVFDFKRKEVISFIVPNSSPGIQSLKSFVSTIREIEISSEINFFPEISKELQSIESRTPDLHYWNGIN